MNLNIRKIVALLFFIVYNVFPADCQEVESDFGHNYDFRKLIEKAVEFNNISESLKLFSKEDLEIIHGIEKVLPNSIQPMLLNLLSHSASDKCNRDLEYMQESYTTPWGMKMLDSYGKPGSGILQGNVRWLGDYDECLDIRAPPKENTDVGNFRGKYCSLQIPLKLGALSLPVSMAVCLPDSCSPNGTVLLRDANMDGILSGFDQRIGPFLSDATLSCKATSKKWTAGAIITIFLLSIFVLLALIGSSITSFEYFIGAETTSQDDKVEVISGKKIASPDWLEKIKPFFNCFCIFTNGEKILDTSGAEGQLPCLHGFRFLSMSWVILCHGYGVAASFSNNGLQAVSIIDHWTFQVVLNGYYSVDAFFVLSGFLVAYVYFKQADKTDGKIPWVYFYVHRYIRLTPVYMLVMAFFAAVSPYLGSGPMWPDYTVVKACKDNWWWNVLYINNFLSMNTEECMNWGWYLANDMQFYVICPLFLITLWRWPKIGYSILGAFFCMTFIANFAITYVNELVVTSGNILGQPEQQKYNKQMDNFFDMIYIKPYTRIGSYLVGLGLAYYLYKRKQNDSGKLNLKTVSIGWIVASTIALTCQFGLYHKPVLSLVAACFYNALSRIAYSLALAWVIFICVTGQGGFVNAFLSWKAWIPLSRLTYCAYLVHALVQTSYAFSLRTMLTFSHVNVVMMFLGFLVVTYVAALMTSLLFESPVIRLERLIRNKFAS
ncbi:nose resistant to fluoxetine protein 6-like [Argiope bruennichi]|uniref:nose resistant to fluoxetine protein 6-like n=1 Tax=Argiope bruennichi TaxID=94029 RepID=UPI002493F6D2|nr:nose resistant to fluoxetine protein 6-like [Argiope bruennichi]